MEKNIIKEFTGISNDQAYAHVFSLRMMNPVPNHLGKFFGTDQREYMLPVLDRLISELPQNAEIFDVGAGAGDVVDFALKNAKPGTVINIEEPNPILLNAYNEKIKKYGRLSPGIAFQGALQDLYEKKNQAFVPKKPQDLILALHMIYHLTGFTSAEVDAEGDLIKAVSFLYERLASHGSLFIVYADLEATSQGEAVCSMAEKYFESRYPDEPYAKNLLSIYRARNALLGEKGSIAKVLKNLYPGTHPTLSSQKVKSHFFGDTIEDIAALGLATELCPSDSDPFEIDKLKFCLNYVKENPNRIGLVKEERNVPQKGMWRANEPQVLATISKG